MFEDTSHAFGTLHVVVSNAGPQRDAAFDAMTLCPGFESGGRPAAAA
ncbi:hypothetical protein [Burkholderia anthina]|nr:hypothetical protein [Burkholderia anthina]